MPHLAETLHIDVIAKKNVIWAVSVLSRTGYNIIWHLLPLSEDEGVKDIGHNISIKNLIFGVNSVTVSYCSHWEGEEVSEKVSIGEQGRGLSGQNACILKDLSDM